MGYILAGVLMLVVLGVVIAALSRSGKKPPQGTVKSDKPVAVEKPAADEPTPGDSVIASDSQAERASRHTPSA